MKRTIITVIISALILSLCGCSSGEKKAAKETAAETETQKTAETAAEAEAKKTAETAAEAEAKKAAESSGKTDAQKSVESFGKTDAPGSDIKKSADGISAEEDAAVTAAFLDRVCGSYMYEDEDELENRLFEIRCVDGNFYIEYEGEYEYAGAEITLSGMNTDAADGTDCFDVTMYPFSGFSQAGRYWNDGTKCTMTVQNDGTLILSKGQPFIDQEELNLSEITGQNIHASVSGCRESTAVDALIGSWRCSTSADGAETGYYAEFARGGRFTLVKKTVGSPAEMYLGRYDASRNEDGITGDILCERFAYGGMPFEWKIRYDDSGYYPVILDAYDDSPVLTSDDGTPAFSKVSGAYDYSAEPVGRDQDGQITSWEISIGSGIDQIITAEIDFGSIYYPESGEEMFYEDDVNFDGLSDLIIYRSSMGAQGAQYCDCYVNAGDRFIRCEGFEEIPNPVPYKESHIVYGHIRDGAEQYYEMTYEISDFKAELTGETLFVYDEEKEDYLPVE